MKYSIIIVFVLIYLKGFSQNEISKAMIEFDKQISSYNVSKIDTEYFEKKTIKNIFYYDAESVNRKVISYYETGELESIFNRNEHGNMNGLILEFFKSSKLKSHSVFNNGIGITYDYYKDGRIKNYYQSSEIGYTGYSSSYCSEGELYSEIFHDSLDYIQEGYHCNGNLRFKGRIINNELKEGKWEYWNKEGVLIKEETWDKGELIDTKEH